MQPSVQMHKSLRLARPATAKLKSVRCTTNGVQSQSNWSKSILLTGIVALAVCKCKQHFGLACSGSPVPRLDYSSEERQCWGTVLTELQKLYPAHACREFLQNLDTFGFHPRAVPQLEDVSQILRYRYCCLGAKTHCQSPFWS